MQVKDSRGVEIKIGQLVCWTSRNYGHGYAARTGRIASVNEKSRTVTAVRDGPVDDFKRATSGPLPARRVTIVTSLPPAEAEADA